MARETLPILKETIIFQDPSEKKDLNFGYNEVVAAVPQLARANTATKQVSAHYREDTITINFFVIESFIPMNFEWRETFAWGQEESKPYRMKTTPKFGYETRWHRNHTIRLVLSFRGKYPRLYRIYKESIKDVSEMHGMVLGGDKLSDDIRAVLAAELKARYPAIPTDMGFLSSLRFTRYQMARDLAKHGIELGGIAPMRVERELYAPPKTIPKDWGVGDWINDHLQEFATRSTRRVVLDLLKENHPDRVARQIWQFRGIARFFDVSQWGEVLACAIHDVPVNRNGQHVFDNLSPARRLRLVREMTELNNLHWVVNDAALQYRPNADLERCRTWAEIHDAVAQLHQIEARNRQLERNKIIREGTINQDPYSPGSAGTIDGVEADGYTIITPKVPYELVEWGEKLSHCIGGYAVEAHEGHSLFFALTREDEIVFTGWINPRQRALVQLRGKHNSILPDKLLKEVVAVLKKHELLHPAHKDGESYYDY